MARGFGWVRKKKVKNKATGGMKLRYYASYLNPADKSERINAPVAFDTEGDARRWLADEHALISSGGWTRPQDRIEAQKRRNTTFGEFAERWFTRTKAKRGWKPRTEQTYRQRLNTQLLPVFGSTCLTDITVDMVEDWYAGMASKPSERGNDYGLLKQIMASACEPPAPLLTFNPCRIRGGSSHEGEERKVASQDEVRAIADAMPPRLQLAVLLAAWLALRSGEVRALRRRDFDLKGRVLHVTHALAYTSRTGFVDAKPKTAAGKRDVVIPDFLVSEIADHLRKYVGKEGDSLLFCTSTGGFLHYSQVEKPYLKARKAVGCPDLTFHDLRHSGATWAMQAGADLADLQARCGWATPAMAMHYAHSTDDRQRQVATGLDALAQGKPEAGKDDTEILKTELKAVREENHRLMKLLEKLGGADIAGAKVEAQ